MAVFDTNVIPLYDQAYGAGNWKALEKDAEVPDYVKAAIARGDYNSSLGLSPELLKSAKLGTFDVNGQTNYGFEIPQELRKPIMDDNGSVIGYTDPAGNILGGEGFGRYGIQVPLAQNQPAEALSGDLRPAFRGQTISGYGDSGAAFDFNGDAATPTRGMLDFAAKVEKDRAAASKVSPLAYLGPLAITGAGLALGPLGGAASLGSMFGGAAEAGAGAATAAPTAGGIGLTGGIPEGSILSMYGADAAPSLVSSGVMGEGALTGTGAVASGATPVSAAPTGILSSAYSSVLDTAIDALQFAGLTPSEAASVAPIVTKSIIGGGVGALSSGISGGDPLKGGLTGALGGGLVGAFGGAEGPLASMLGVSGGVADAIIGAGAGGLGNYVQGQDPVTGALAGGIAGYGSNALLNGSPLTGAAALGASEATKGAGAGGTGGLFGTGKGISGSALALGALAGGAALLGNKNNNTPAATTTTGTTPGPEQVSGTLGPYYNKNLNYDVSGRTVLDPVFGATPSFWTYGGPEKLYFGNNSLKSFGFADGGYVEEDEVYPTDDGRPFSTEEGDSHVRGPGTGTSDSIDARLSDGEYVLTAREISDAGDGDNSKGAMKLDRLRKSGALARFLADA